MMKGITYKITVIIITYNQEKLIGRALDSILIQKEWGLSEIIICDDCSTDNNWDVIQDYARKYPDIIKPFRNEKNLGIFKNIESTWQKNINGDLVLYVSGDDAIVDGLFVKLYDSIQEQQIDISKGSFCIYSDQKVIFPNSKELILSNKLIAKGYDAVSLKIRGLLFSARGIFYSKELFSRFLPVKEIGIFTDGLIDIQVQLYADKNYYFDFIGGIYYSGIGASSKIGKKESLESYIKLFSEYEKILSLSPKDKKWLKFEIAKSKFRIQPSFKLFCLSVMYFMGSMDFRYGVNCKKYGLEFAYMAKQLFIRH